jgi:hypothetical protein
MNAGRNDGQFESLAVHRGINDASGWVFGSKRVVGGK